MGKNDRVLSKGGGGELQPCRPRVWGGHLDLPSGDTDGTTNRRGCRALKKTGF